VKPASSLHPEVMSNTPPPATDEQASTSAPPPHTLEDASEARKTRLLALRRKRDGDGPGRGYGPSLHIDIRSIIMWPMQRRARIVNKEL
jgi:hypothetical protein